MARFLYNIDKNTKLSTYKWKELNYVYHFYNYSCSFDLRYWCSSHWLFHLFGYSCYVKLENHICQVYTFLLSWGALLVRVGYLFYMLVFCGVSGSLWIFSWKCFLEIIMTGSKSDLCACYVIGEEWAMPYIKKIVGRIGTLFEILKILRNGWIIS